MEKHNSNNKIQQIWHATDGIKCLKLQKKKVCVICNLCQFDERQI